MKREIGRKIEREKMLNLKGRNGYFIIGVKKQGVQNYSS
jgi:hypothetical protein